MDKFIETVRRSGYILPDDAESRFADYADLLAEANLAFGLLSSGDVEHIRERHFLDSLTPLLLRIIEPCGRLLDIGSGAGLPGIPLAIAAPGLDVTMVESIGRKARFVERALDTLDLANAEIIHCRADDLAGRGGFDYCTARAVSAISNLLSIMASHLRDGGKGIFYKGPNTGSEVRSHRELLSRLSLSEPEMIPLSRDMSTKGFSLVIYEKL